MYIRRLRTVYACISTYTLRITYGKVTFLVDQNPRCSVRDYKQHMKNKESVQNEIRVLRNEEGRAGGHKARENGKRRTCPEAGREAKSDSSRAWTRPFDLCSSPPSPSLPSKQVCTPHTPKSSRSTTLIPLYSSIFIFYTMGRPLYSSTSATRAAASATTPAPSPPEVAIRTQPEAAPEQPEVRRWSYWNAFDPDADEFFDGPNAVYEAFVDPSSLPPLREEISEEARRERIMSTLGLVTDLSLARSSSSESESASETVSPYSPGPEATYVHVERAQLSDDSDDDEDEASVPPAASLPPPVVHRVVASVETETEIARSATPPPRPSTPPGTQFMVSTTPHVYTPSPPPTVTPRLFTWAPRNSYPASPLPNRGARMSVPHISPAHVPSAIVNRVHG